MRAGFFFVLSAALSLSCTPPAEVTLSPSTGDIQDGVEVRVEGRGFRGRGRVDVFFGARAAKSVVVESDRLIRARAPLPFEPGRVVVTLHFEDGGRVNVTPEFEYTMPAGVQIRATPVGPQVEPAG